MFKVGEFVEFAGCPFDEQIPGEMDRFARLQDRRQKVTEIQDTTKLSGTTGQWIKTDLCDQWIDKAWFFACTSEGQR